MRLIDADKLIAELQKDESDWDKEADDSRNDPSYTESYSEAMWSRANGIRDAIIEIYDAPTIDIVRCSECKYASDDGTYGCMCEHFNDTSDAYHRMWSDDFCSRRERNSSEKPNNSKERSSE